MAFDTIKGKNTDPEDVTHNLALSMPKPPSTGLEIVRWESSHQCDCRRRNRDPA